MAFILVYLLPCYHPDKLEKHLVSYPIFLSQLYFSHLFFLHLLSSSFICALRLRTLALPRKVGSSDHKLRRKTFSFRRNERNEHFWMKWSRTLHSNQTCLAHLFPSALPLRGNTSVRCRPLVAEAHRRHPTVYCTSRCRRPFHTLVRRGADVAAARLFSPVSYQRTLEPLH